MEIKEIFKLLKNEGLEPHYIKIDDVGFSRWIEFDTKYQKCWIEWYCNVSTLRVGDMYGIRIPFTHIAINPHSPANKRCLEFSNKPITELVDGKLIDCEVDFTLEKLDWQEKSAKTSPTR